MEFISKSLAQLNRGLLVSALRVLAGADRQARSEVLHWIFAGDDGGGDGGGDAPAWPAGPLQAEQPFSFERCCRHAGVDAGRMRERLLGILARLGVSHRAAARGADTLGD